MIESFRMMEEEAALRAVDCVVLLAGDTADRRQSPRVTLLARRLQHSAIHRRNPRRIILAKSDVQLALGSCYSPNVKVDTEDGVPIPVVHQLRPISVETVPDWRDTKARPILRRWNAPVAPRRAERLA